MPRPYSARTDALFCRGGPWAALGRHRSTALLFLERRLQILGRHIAVDHGQELLQLSDGTRIPATISTYGISRLSVCQVAPLKLTLSGEATAGTPFAGLHTVRFVPPCHIDEDYEQYAVLEYLVYRSYQVVASPAVRVRPVDFELRGPGHRRAFHEGFGYLIEDLTQWPEIGSLRSCDMDRGE